MESSARFGIVAGGIYSATAMASSGSSAVATTSAGTVTAGAGVSTTTVVAAGTDVAAAGVGTAVAVSGGGDGDGGDEKMNSIASISWGDDDAAVGDAFQVMVGSQDIGAKPPLKTNRNHRRNSLWNR